MRKSLVVLVVALVACQAPPASAPTPALTGPAADVARSVVALLAPNAQVEDLPLEDAIAGLDLSKSLGARGGTIVDQIRKTRAAVEKRATSSTTSGPHLASIAPVVGNFSFSQFAHDFGFVLDERTEKGGTISYPANNLTATESDNATTTTTTLSVTQTFSASRSVVTATLRWMYSSITIDITPNGGGKTLVHVQDDREFEGKIDVCPDASGAVPASLKVSSKIVADKDGLTLRRTSTGNSTFKGNVNDQAALTGVSQVSKYETSTDSTSGSSGTRSSTEATWNLRSDSLLGNLDDGSFRATLETTGIATAEQAAKAAGWDTALGIFAVEPAYLSARTLWQHGRCVVVAVPEWSAETPIKINEQQTPQHTEEVDVSSDTKFKAELRQRFGGGTLNKPTTAELTSGKEKLTPNKLESGAGELTYKAGDEENKKATAVLRSTSNRGIGTLVLEFQTKGGLTLSVEGTLRLNSPGSSPVTSLTVAAATFEKQPDKTYRAQAGYTGRTRLVPPDEDCPDLLITETGTLEWTATVEKRGEDKSVWLVRATGRGNVSATGTGSDGCEASEAQAVGGLFVGVFLEAVGVIEIPAEGGTVQLRGSSSLIRGATASGTATGSAKK
jgi:hypothetical protein